MKNLLPLASGLSVKPISLALRQNPDLWNQYRDRTTVKGGPHAAVDDIWVRYAADVKAGQSQHESLWYPAAQLLPMVRDMAFEVMHMVKGEQLGGVLITRIPAGRKVLRHEDLGWHAEYYDKFAVQVESHQQQAFHFDDGSYCAAPGDLYWFRNQAAHWVTNDSPVDRITLIFCIRTAQPHHNPITGASV